VVQGLDATTEHLGKAGDVRDVEVRNLGVAQASRYHPSHEFDTVGVQARGEFDQSGLVPDAQLVPSLRLLQGASYRRRFDSFAQ